MNTVEGKPEWAQSKREKENAQRVAAGLKPKRRIVPWIILGLVVVGGGAFFMLQPPAPPVDTAEAETVVTKLVKQSETTVIAPQTLQQKVRVTGTFVPGQQAEVAAQASGRVLTVSVQPGDVVAQGQILLQIDTESLEIQLNQQRSTAEATRAQFLSSQSQLQRTEELARSGLTTPSALEQARSSTSALEANLAALENGVKAAELALKNATVIAPIGGIVSARSVEPGQTVSAGTPLLTVVNLDRIEFQASASVASSALIATGQQASVTVTGLDGREFNGVVARVNPVAVAGTRTVPVYIMLENTDNLLRGGMFAAGQIVVNEKSDAIAVLKAAVREDAEGFYVLKVEDSVLKRQAVELGTEWDRGRIVEVTGISAGDQVISAPLPQLAADETIELVEG